MALLALAVVGIGLNVWIALPFIPGLAWGFAFAVVAQPVYRWIRTRVRKQGLAAGLAVAIVAMAIVLPATFLIWQIASEAGDAAVGLKGYLDSGEWQRLAERFPSIAQIWQSLSTRIDIKEHAQGLLGVAEEKIVGWMRSAASGVIQVLIALFALFYFFRDRDVILGEIGGFIPLSERETNHLFKRVRDTTHATIFGTVMVSAVQGFLGGLMFWFLGLPAPLIWGAAMGLLAIIPVFGAFVIWLPAAVFLAAQGAWIKALILAVWGSVVVGLIDNLLYPILVGNELRLHTLPVFIAIVGGLIAFGASGVVLGPVILATTLAVFDILKRRGSSGSSKQGITDKAA
jgi:predicted PurR-regulated permease PerM